MSLQQFSDLTSRTIQEIGALTRDQFLAVLQDLETSGTKSEIQRYIWARFATDVESFAAYYFSHYCQHDFNELHRDLFTNTSFAQRAIRRVRGAPRGYAKSTLEAFIKPIHDVCYGLESFILMVSNTQSQADQKLADIRTEILTNTELANDYGIHFKTKKPGTTKYILYRQNYACLFASVGAGAEVRGVRFGRYRPTKIICDDMEHSEEVNNEALRKKYSDWFFQVISKLGTKTTNISVIGTVLHPESLLSDLTKNPAYDAKIYKAIKKWSERQDLWDKWTKIYTDLDNPNRKEQADEFYRKNEWELLRGTDVLWNSYESYLDLMKEMIEIGRRAFMKEKQNEPLAGDEILFEKILFYRETSEGLLIEHSGKVVPWDEFKSADGKFLNAYGVLDPAAGQDKQKPGRQSDFAAQLAGLKDRVGRLFVHHDWLERISPTRQIERIFDADEIYDFQKFGVEINLFRNLMMPNIAAERKRREEKLKRTIKVDFYEIENTENKQKRIFTLEPKVTHGWILFNRSLSQTFMRQLESFPHGDHDDGPDALEMLWGLVNNRYKIGGLNKAVGAR